MTARLEAQVALSKEAHRRALTEAWRAKGWWLCELRGGPLDGTRCVARLTDERQATVRVRQIGADGIPRLHVYATVGRPWTRKVLTARRECEYSCTILEGILPDVASWDRDEGIGFYYCSSGTVSCWGRWVSPAPRLAYPTLRMPRKRLRRRQRMPKPEPEPRDTRFRIRYWG